MQETRVRPLDWDDPLEKEMATQSSVLAMDRGEWWATVHGVERVRHDLATKQLQLQLNFHQDFMSLAMSMEWVVDAFVSHM